MALEVWNETGITECNTLQIRRRRKEWIVFGTFQSNIKSAVLYKKSLTNKMLHNLLFMHNLYCCWIKMKRAGFLEKNTLTRTISPHPGVNPNLLLDIVFVVFHPCCCLNLIYVPFVLL